MKRNLLDALDAGGGASWAIQPRAHSLPKDIDLICKSEFDSFYQRCLSLGQLGEQVVFIDRERSWGKRWSKNPTR